MRTLMAAAAVLIVSGCDQSAPEQATKTEIPVPVEPDSGIGDGAGPPREQEAAIPASLQGRWGLAPADCISSTPQATGLLVVSPDRLSFYESRGTLREVRPDDRGGFRAVYAFTGEGMEWMREIAFELDDSEDRLIRRDFGEGASGEALTYTRCG